MKKIVAINASPRKGWNTDMIVMEAAKGAERAGWECLPPSAGRTSYGKR